MGCTSSKAQAVPVAIEAAGTAGGENDEERAAAAALERLVFGQIPNFVTLDKYRKYLADLGKYLADLGAGFDFDFPEGMVDNAVFMYLLRNLRPELQGHVARNLPVGSDLVNLLLCVDRSSHSLIQRIYLTGNEKFLEHHLSYDKRYRSICGRIAETKPFILIWMKHNEKLWRKWCAGKILESNLLTVSLTPEQLQSMQYRCNYDSRHSLKGDADTAAALTEVGVEVRKLGQLAGGDVESYWNNQGLASISSLAGDDYADEVTCYFEVDSSCSGPLNGLVDDVDLNRGGMIKLELMKHVIGLFAHPIIFIKYDLEEVLTFVLDEGIVQSTATITENSNMAGTEVWSLLGWALVTGATSCALALLSRSDTDINAVAFDDEEESGDEFAFRAIDLCVWEYTEANVCLRALKAILDYPGVHLDVVPRLHGRTPICMVCGKIKYQVFSSPNKEKLPRLFEKLRLLLEAGADPRIGAEGVTPAEILEDAAARRGAGEHQAALEATIDEVSERVKKLNAEEALDNIDG